MDQRPTPLSPFTGVHTTVDSEVFDVVKMISRLAQKEHSAALSKLASRLSAVNKFDASAGEGPFSSVKEVITDLLCSWSYWRTAGTPGCHCLLRISLTEETFVPGP